jgi:hypothetical protein
MASADRLAARRPGRGPPLARGDGTEDAAAVTSRNLPLRHLVISSNGNPSAFPRPKHSRWYSIIAFRTGISNTPFVIP